MQDSARCSLVGIAVRLIPGHILSVASKQPAIKVISGKGPKGQHMFMANYLLVSDLPA